VAALLHRGQAQRPRRGRRVQPDDFVARVNADLVGKYVNIASRAANFINKKFDGALRFDGDTAALVAQARRDAATVADFYEARESGKALREIMAIADRINGEFDTAQPGCSPRIRRAAPSCRTSARGHCTGSRCSRSCSRRCCRRSPAASRASCSAATPSSPGRTSTTCRHASRRTST
jgi:hypothetical protein